MLLVIYTALVRPHTMLQDRGQPLLDDYNMAANALALPAHVGTIHGQGLIAQHDIPLGTQILEENPLVVCYTGFDPCSMGAQQWCKLL